jgi:beta-lactamase regulating signal transducer with metallopeptidase domain
MSAWSPLPLRILPTQPSSSVALERSSDTPPTVSNIPSAPREVPSASESAATPPPSFAFPHKVFFVWAIVAALLMTWLVLGAVSVRRILRRSRTLTGEEWLTPLYETADRLDLDRVPRLLMSPAIEMPFACSILKPAIVLPASAEQWSDERRRVVLFHELAHIRRRDLLGHTLGRIVCAFYWFHPLVWSAAKQLRAESERACDDLVLACGARASDYAHHLLEIVTGVRRQGAPATALPMANRREFEGRMLAILDPAVRRATPSRGQKLLLTLGLSTVALTIAAVAPTRRAASAPPPRQYDYAMTGDSAPADTAPARERSGIRERELTTSPSASPSPSAAPAPVAQPQAPSVWQRPQVQSSQLPQGQQSATALDTALLGRVLRTDRDEDVRRSAAWALQGRRDGAPLLVERLRVDESESVREMAAWALGGIGGVEAEKAVADALTKDRSVEVRATAAWALGHFRGDDHLPALEAALNDDASEVRHRALWAIGQHDLSTAPAKVVGMLKDADVDVRLIASWVLGNVLDRATIPALREAFLAERDEDAQLSQFRALLFMNDRSPDVIEKAMKSEYSALRAKAVRMIAGSGPGVWPWPWPWPQPRPHP